MFVCKLFLISTPLSLSLSLSFFSSLVFLPLYLFLFLRFSLSLFPVSPPQRKKNIDGFILLCILVPSTLSFSCLSRLPPLCPDNIVQCTVWYSEPCLPSLFYLYFAWAMRRRMGRRGKMRSMTMYIFWPRWVVGVTLQHRSIRNMWPSQLCITINIAREQKAQAQG